MSKFTKEMVDKYADKVLIGLTAEENKMVVDEIDMIDDTAIDLTDFDAAFKNIKKNVDFLVESYVYYPYLINMHDIALMAFLSEIKSEKGFSDFKVKVKSIVSSKQLDHK